MLISSVSAIDTVCDAQAASNCFVDYFKSWGYPKEQFPPDRYDFAKVYDGFLNDSITNVDIVCTRHDTLFKCLGSDIECVKHENIRSALHLGYGNKSTAFYSTMMFEEQYICYNNLKGYKLAWDSRNYIPSCYKTEDDNSCDTHVKNERCRVHALFEKYGWKTAKYYCNINSITLKYASPCLETLDCDNLNSSSKLGFGLSILFVIVFYFLK
ncbi:hypothetical protein FO519_010046 [Halicephalobus sp. NKZ332]|nr:hypothetical protein FO519_010046 [Halicephalobus sp. NKZ332]